MNARIFRGSGAFPIAIVQALIVGAMLALPVTASQFPLSNPTSGTLSGLSMVQNYNNAIDAVASCNSGGSPPTTQFLSGAPSLGNCWLNTTNNSVNFNDGTGNWVTVGYIDPANHLFIPLVGGGAVSSVASAATTNLCSSGATTARGSNIAITGTTAITSFGSNCVAGQIKFLTFGGALTLTYNAASMILPTAASITTAAGDTAMAISLGSGNWQILFYQPATGAALSTVGLNVGASALTQSAQGYGSPLNLQLAAAVSGNSLTVSVVGVNGSNPSTSNPVLVNFRSQTLNNGSNGIVYGQITAPLSFQVTSGNTMGCTTAVLCRLWVTLICRTESSGTCTDIRLGLSDQSIATQIFPLAEDVLQTTGSGTTGGGTPGLIQANIAAMSGVAIRIAGYVEVTWTSGTGWATTPSKVQVFGPGVHKPGDVVQTAFAQTSSNASNTTASMIASNVTASIAPSSAVNPVIVNITANVNAAAVSTATESINCQAARGSTLIGQLISAGLGVGNTGSFFGGLAFTVLDNPGVVSATSYTLYFETANSGHDVNVVGGHILLQEIMGALAPTNDNAAPLRLVG